MSLGLGLASPGIVVKEVDLTKGSPLEQNQFIGVIAGPFEQGPIEEVVTIRNEDELVRTFGKPKNNGDQYEYYYAAETFLSYGGIVKVVRTSSNTHSSANVSKFIGSNSVGVATTAVSGVEVKNTTDYNENYIDNASLTWEWSARNPGIWANNLKVCVIDDAADQIITGIDTSYIQVGSAVTFAMTAPRTSAGIGSTTVFNTSTVLNGIVTEIEASQASVKWNYVRIGSGTSTVDIEYKPNSNFELKDTETVYFNANANYSETIDQTTYTTKDWYDQQKIVLDNTNIF